MAEHTPGPWKQHKAPQPDNVGGYDYAITTPDRLILAEVFERPSYGVTFPAEANARLIAAAPDLLAALNDLLDVQNGPPLIQHKDAWQEAVDAAYAAIAKAEGREGGE